MEEGGTRSGIVGAMPANAQLLGEVPLFAGLPEEDLIALASRLRQRKYGRGEAVFLHGDPGTSLFIVESGRIKVGFTSSEGREVIFEIANPGDEFGELALLDGEPRSTDAVAIEPSVLLLLHREDFTYHLERRPRVALQLLAVLSRRLRRNAELMQDAVFLDVPARLARTILRLAADDTATQEGGRPLTPHLYQSDLAGIVGTTRETLNKWLGIYETQGMIRLVKGRIAVLDAEALRRRIY
jgi:CRP/FNR family transcriptional regulator, cyclic AMP receptor protein